MKLLQADWVFPMDRPPIRDGAVLIDGPRIAAIGGAELARLHPQAQFENLGDSAILPGLINAHTHLELSDCTPGDPLPFVPWLMRLITRPSNDDSICHATRIGIAQCHRFGVTTVGDISRQCHLTRPILADSLLRAVSYGELQAMAQRRGLLEERLTRACDSTSARDHLTIGLTPHAPYSIEPAGFIAALEHHVPLATHLAETPDEDSFLSHHTGPFRDLWNFIGGWDDHVPTFTGGPIRFADSLGLFAYPTLLAHVNYCDDEELKLLATSRASVVYCPRTHAYFRHPPHRWQDMISAGINVAIATDSCASSPDLNLVEELRFLHRLVPSLPPNALWQMATTSAARALGLQKEIGSLNPGKWADLTIFPAPGPDPLKSILENSALPTHTYFAGQEIPP